MVKEYISKLRTFFLFSIPCVGCSNSLSEFILIERMENSLQ